MTTKKPTTTNDNKEPLPVMRDEFSSSEFLDPKARLPRIQALRGENPAQCGYFVPGGESAKAGFDFALIEEYLTDYTFNSGESETGFLFKQPRMLVVARSGLLGFSRQQTKEEGNLAVLGHWQKSFKENADVGNVQMYEVVLLGKDDKPLHSSPLSYVAKGANGASFSQEWQKFCWEITNCRALNLRIAAREMDARFRVCCVFEPVIAREIVGKKEKAPVCKIVGHTVATLENWKSLFIGYDAPLKEQIWESLQPLTIAPAEKYMAIAPAVDVVADAGWDAEPENPDHDWGVLSEIH